MRKILPYLLLLLLTCGVYAPVVRNGFVWDDTALVLRDPLIRSWRLIPEGFQHFLFTDATASDFYRPLQRLTFTLEYAAFAFRPAAYHVDSILCHATAALMLLLFAREFLRLFDLEERRREWMAFIAATLWTIHPLHTSAVAYISGRADSLAAAFGFAGLYFALRSLRAHGRILWLFTTFAGFLLLLSALSKEAGLIFLASWILLLLVQGERKALLRAGAVVAFILIVYASLRFSAEHIAAPPARPIPALVRPLLLARALAEYTGLIFFPINLHMDRDVESHPFGFSDQSMSASAWRELQTIAGLILLAGFIYWALKERKRNRAAYLCLLLTALTYLPISGIFPLNASLAEHWLYLPTAFFFLAAVSSCARMLAFGRFRKIATLSLLGLWMIFLGGRTFVRTFDWKDQRTFLIRTIGSGGDSARMLINLGGLELNENHFDEAKKHLRAALQKEPDQPLGILDLAAVAVKQSDFKTAHELLPRAAEMPLVEAQAYELMAVLESKETGRANPVRMRLASRTGAPNWAIEKRYVKLLYELGGSDAAIAELQQCLVTQWYRADTWQLLGQMLSETGRKQDADAAFQQAARYDVHLAPPP